MKNRLSSRFPLVFPHSENWVVSFVKSWAWKYFHCFVLLLLLGFLYSHHIRIKMRRERNTIYNIERIQRNPQWASRRIQMKRNEMLFSSLTCFIFLLFHSCFQQLIWEFFFQKTWQKTNNMMCLENFLFIYSNFKSENLNLFTFHFILCYGITCEISSEKNFTNIKLIELPETNRS